MKLLACLIGAVRMLRLLIHLRFRCGIHVPLRLVTFFAPWRGNFLLTCGKPSPQLLLRVSPETLPSLMADGDRMIGLWGHGVNSYFFYLSLRDGERLMHHRLPYGGVYSDQAALVREMNAALRAIAQGEA